MFVVGVSVYHVDYLISPSLGTFTILLSKNISGINQVDMAKEGKQLDAKKHARGYNHHGRQELKQRGIEDVEFPVKMAMWVCQDSKILGIFRG
jgi:hypothetical protein